MASSLCGIDFIFSSLDETISLQRQMKISRLIKLFSRVNDQSIG